MKTDMKFPCLVTCNNVQCIAMNENHVIHLEGDYKGKLCITPLFTTYSAPDWSVGIITGKYLEFISDAIKNSNQFFSFGATPRTRTIDISDIDFSPWKGDTKLFFDDVETLKKRVDKVRDFPLAPFRIKHNSVFEEIAEQARKAGETLKQQPWKPTVSEQVTMTFNGDVHCTGELLFVSDQYAIVRIGEKQEQHYHLGEWEITKPVSNEDKLKKLWLECGESIYLFIAAVSKQYKEV